MSGLRDWLVLVVDRTPCRTHIFLSLVVSRMSGHI